MALGGGTWSAQNKVLPGTYINVVSAKQGIPASERGIVAFPMELSWGPVGKATLITESQFSSNCRELLGYNYESEEMKPFRDIFCHAERLYLYRLAKNPVEATGSFSDSSKLATAAYPGDRGNRITIQVKASVDEEEKKIVSTYLDGLLVDSQTVETAAELTDNSFVTFEKEVELKEEMVTLSGGSNGDSVTGTEYQAFLDEMEGYYFNVLGSVVADETTKQLFAAYTQRMRDKVGKKFQCVLYRHPADYEGVVSVENKVTDDGAAESSAVYWAAGALAGCDINEELTNMAYDGEYAIDTGYRQADLETALQSGKFIFHRQDDEVRVLEDINTLVSTTADKGDVFKQNMTIRVIDQIALDIASTFNNTYNGKVPNDEDGRVGLKSDIVSILNRIQTQRAIQNFSEDDVSISQGDTPKSVVGSIAIQVTGMMTHLYLTVVVD